MNPPGFLSGYIMTAIVLLQLAACHRPMHLTGHTGHMYTPESGGGDSMMTAMIAPYKRSLDSTMRQVIGHTDIPLTKAQPESTLGNFFADAQLAAALEAGYKADAAVSNYGAIRLAYVRPGPLTLELLYELMPFDSRIVIVDIPGAVLRHFCDFIAARKGWPVSGLQFAVKDGKAENILIGGNPLNDHLVYRLAVNDYMAGGGDQCDFLVPLRKQRLGIVVRDAMIGYVARLERSGEKLHPVLENRIRYE